jgi:hypothetical protein
MKSIKLLASYCLFCTEYGEIVHIFFCAEPLGGAQMSHDSLHRLLNSHALADLYEK